MGNLVLSFKFIYFTLGNIMRSIICHVTTDQCNVYSRGIFWPCWVQPS